MPDYKKIAENTPPSPGKIKFPGRIILKGYPKSTVKSNNREEELKMGRCAPNWTCTVPREALNTLGIFAAEESYRDMDSRSGLGGIPRRDGISARFEGFVRKHGKLPGMTLLREMYIYGLRAYHFHPDDWVMEMTEGALGSRYPDNNRVLPHCGMILHDFLIQELCGNRPRHSGRFDICARDGASGAVRSLMEALAANKLLLPGDGVAYTFPEFFPYGDAAQAGGYRKVAVVSSPATVKDKVYSGCYYPREELDKLVDPEVKIFFIVNPGNPSSGALCEQSRKDIIDLVRNRRQDLIIVSDDTYGPFTAGYNSLINDLPFNTVSVFSFSKYFGAPGCKLGILALHEDNILDYSLAHLIPSSRKKADTAHGLNEGDQMRFIDRLASGAQYSAISGSGISSQQQVQMMLMAAFAILDTTDSYRKECRSILNKRKEQLSRGLEGRPVIENYGTGYYIGFDIDKWLTSVFGLMAGNKFDKDKTTEKVIKKVAALYPAVAVPSGEGTEKLYLCVASMTERECRGFGRNLKKIVEESSGLLFQKK